MNVTAIYLAALFGAIGGGGGALLGLLLAKRLPEKYRVLSVGVGAALGVSLSSIATDVFKSTGFREELGQAALNDSELTHLIAENYPEDFKASLNRYNQDTDSAQARQYGRQLTESLRRREAPNARKADVMLIRTYMTEVSAVLKTMEEKQGIDACYSYLTTGQISDVGFESLAKSVEKTAIAMFEVLISGRDSSESPRAPATPEDQARLTEALKERGLDDQALSMLVVPPPEPDARYCQVFQEFYSTLGLYDAEGADRVRTDVMEAIAAG